MRILKLVYFFFHYAVSIKTEPLFSKKLVLKKRLKLFPMHLMLTNF